MEQKTIERFCRDYMIPIQVSDEKYFNYYIQLYDKDLKSIEKYNILKKELEKHESEQEFNKYYIDKRNEIANHILHSKGYQIFADPKNIDFLTPDQVEKLLKKEEENPFLDPDYLESLKSYIDEKYKIKDSIFSFTKKSDVYNPLNSGKYYVSIDLKKANFQVLKYYDSSIFQGTDTYEEFISIFTDSEYIKQSKYFRQYIFGQLYMERIVKLQKYFVHKVLKYLITEGYFLKDEIRVFTTDEVVFETNSYLDKDNINKLEEIIKEKLGILVSVESFQIQALEKGAGFVKLFYNGEKKFKMISSIYFPQVYKRYYNLPLEERDFLFLYENLLCKFIKPFYE